MNCIQGKKIISILLTAVSNGERQKTNKQKQAEI